MEINDKSFTQIKEFLLEQPMARISPSGKELNMRCPFCGDSRKSSISTNFSINIDPNSERFMSYQCFRASCLARGIVNQDFLSSIGFNKYECIQDLNEYMRSINKKIGGKYRSKHKKEIYNVVNSNGEVELAKLKYINKRLGLDLTFQDIYDLKINLSLLDLLNVNRIPISKNKFYYYTQLSKYGIIFISAYNDYVIIRDISKSNKLHKRYVNINIFDNYDNVTKCYCIPTEIDLLTPETTVINICEGAFDIIGVYYHLDIDRDYKNQIYVAACGAGIVNIIKHYIQQYGLLDIKLNIFSDADVDKKTYKKLEELKKYVINLDITVYYNRLEKDFGVRKDQIDIVKSKI